MGRFVEGVDRRQATLLPELDTPLCQSAGRYPPPS
jgi:hypothetical protein